VGIKKRIVKWVLFNFVLMLSTGCQPKTNTEEKQAPITDSTQHTGIKNKSEIVDTGQVYFNVSITKNDTPYIHYEGDWPLLLSSNNSSTVQLAASKKLMSITNMLTIYMHGLPAGKIPVVLSNRDADKVSMIMTPVVNGNYDIPIMPGEGFLNITKNTGKVLSGTFDAKAVDANKNVFLFTGTFLNVGVNDDSHIK
jgi:hypothetical protein